MKVKSLELENFRNYKELEIEFNPDINIIFGKNAQGKTNILEATYVCSTTKSHRTKKDSELINFNKKEGHIKLFLEKRQKEYRIDVHLRKNKSKGIAINGIPIKKASDLFGIFNVIFFAPENLNIIKDGPSERRKFIDMELCQLDKVYVYNLIKYNKVLNQRNKLLKDISFDKTLIDTLDSWDAQLIEYGSEIINRREKFIKELSKIIKPIHNQLTNDEENLEIKYSQSTSAREFKRKLKFNRSKDIKYKMTTIGPHRDDLLFYIDSLNVRTYGSQGQKRTTALSLKLAEIELVKEIIGDTPVLLLDDVLSELDSDRQNHLLEKLKGIQTIITCTGLDDFIENNVKVDKVFEIQDGEIVGEEEND